MFLHKMNNINMILETVGHKSIRGNIPMKYVKIPQRCQDTIGKMMHFLKAGEYGEVSDASDSSDDENESVKTKFTKVGFWRVDGTMTIHKLHRYDIDLDQTRDSDSRSSSAPILRHCAVLFGEIVPAEFDPLIYRFRYFTDFNETAISVINDFLELFCFSLESVSFTPFVNRPGHPYEMRLEIVNWMRLNSVGLRINGLLVNEAPEMRDIIDERLQKKETFDIYDVCVMEKNKDGSLKYTSLDDPIPRFANFGRVVFLNEPDTLKCIRYHINFDRVLINLAFFHIKHPYAFKEPPNPKEFLNELHTIRMFSGIKTLDDSSLANLISRPAISKTFKRNYGRNLVRGARRLYTYTSKDYPRSSLHPDEVEKNCILTRRPTIFQAATNTRYTNNLIVPGTYEDVTITTIDVNSMFPWFILEGPHAKRFEDEFDVSTIRALAVGRFDSSMPLLWKFAVNATIAKTMNNDMERTFRILINDYMAQIRAKIAKHRTVLYGVVDSIVFFGELDSIEEIAKISVGPRLGQWKVEVKKGTLIVSDNHKYSLI